MFLKISNYWLLLACFMCFTCCHSPNDSSQKHTNTEWEKLRCGLYINKKGELGFATEPNYVNIPASELKPEQCANVFITKMGSSANEMQKLNDIVDTATFEQLGADYYKDKSHIYNFYGMCESGYLTIFADDTATFKVIGCCYAIYQNIVYHQRNGIMKADANSFRTSAELGPFAKDRNTYFAHEKEVSESQIKKELDKELFEKLKSL